MVSIVRLLFTDHLTELVTKDLNREMSSLNSLNSFSESIDGGFWFFKKIVEIIGANSTNVLHISEQEFHFCL